MSILKYATVEARNRVASLLRAGGVRVIEYKDKRGNYVAHTTHAVSIPYLDSKLAGSFMVLPSRVVVEIRYADHSFEATFRFKEGFTGYSIQALFQAADEMHTENLK